MRKIYLVRHGRAEQPEGGRRCIGRTDLPLAPQGEAQARALGAWLLDHPVTAVYSSPLRRARDTAAQMARACALPVLCRDDLQEVDTGAWEGLPFSQIRERWPALYEERGRRLATCAPPGGETFLEAGKRLERALFAVLEQTRGDVAVVSHSGAIRGLLCTLQAADPDRLMELAQPCGGVTTLLAQGAALCVAGVGVMPVPWPPDEEIVRLHRAQRTPQAVIDHERAVTDEALALAKGSGAKVSLPLLRAACLLHDVCRAEGRAHPAAAAALLVREGYPQLAEVIARHHDLGQAPGAEAELLYLADKRMDGTTRTTLQARFARSREKCRTGEALQAWQARYDAALMLERRYGPERRKGDASDEADED